MKRVPGAAVRLVAIIAAVCTVWSTPALALTDEEVFRQMRFNYIQPGSKRLRFIRNYRPAQL